MLRKRRHLVLEDLESRRVLNGDAISLAPPPPPIDNNVGLVSLHSSSRRVIADDFSGRVEVVRREFTASDVNQPADNPDFLLSGDFNGDGVSDFLSADSVGNWYLHLNDGTTLFELAVGQGLDGVRLLGTADFDMDERLDVASFNETTGQLMVSLNRGDSFLHESWGRLSNPSVWSQLEVGDFNGDGLADVLAGEQGGHWWVAQNHEGAKFNNHRWGRFADYAWVDVLNGEFTGDQYTDVVARAPDNTWWLWEGTPNGFGGSRYFGHWKMRSEWMDVAVADFDADGRDDVIGRSADGTLWVGSATDEAFHTWKWGSGWINNAEWSQVTVLDMNGDGLPDQVGHAKDDTWWYALNTGEGFLNHFWQRRGEVDFVLQDFRRDQPVDLSGSWSDPEDTSSEDSNTTQSSKVSLDATNRLVLSAEAPIGIKSISVRDPNNALTATGQGQFSAFEEVRSGVWRTDLNEAVLVEGDIPLGLVWSPAAGPADFQVTILYGTSAFSVPLDLTTTVVVGEATVTPAPQDTVKGYETYQAGTASVRDGRVVLRGTFDSLAGLEVKSKNGYLSLESIDVPGVGEIQLMQPFPPNAAIVNNSSYNVVIGVLGSDNQINLQGEIDTAILYSGPLEGLADELTVNIGTPSPFGVLVEEVATDSGSVGYQ